LEIDPSDPRNALQPTDVNHDGIGWDGWLGPSTIDRLESLVLKMKNGSDVRSRAMSVKRSQLRNVLGSAISPGWVYDYPAMDQLFTEAAHRRHIEVSSVETKRDQLQRYDVVTNAAINRFIDSAEIVLGDPSCSDPAHTEIFQFQSLWLVTTGQFDRAFRVYESDRCNPSLEEEETTVLSRSPPIANRIDQVLSEGQPTAFAIGTLHLTGPDSVQRHLQRLGYRVRVWTQFNP